MKSQNIIVKILTIATILMVSSCKDQYIPKNQDSKTIPDTYPALEELSTTLTNYTDNFIGTSPTRNGWNRVTAGLADYGGWGLGSKCGFWIGLGAGGFAGAPIGYYSGGITLAAVASLAAILSDNTIPYNQGFIVNPDNPYDFFGETHNQIIKDVMLDKEELCVNGILNRELLLEKTIHAAEKLGCSDINIDPTKLDLFLDETLQLEFTENSINQMFDEMIEFDPEQTTVYEINRQHLLKLAALNTIVDVEEFSTGFENIVVKADIEEADKASLLISSSLVKKVLETILNNYETGLF